MEETYKQFKKTIDNLTKVIDWYQNKMTDLRWMPQDLRDKIPNIEEIKD